MIWYEAVAAIMGGGAVTKGIEYLMYSNKRKDNRSKREFEDYEQFSATLDDFRDRMQSYNEQILEWSRKYHEAQMHITELQSHIKVLSNRIKALELELKIANKKVEDER